MKGIRGGAPGAAARAIGVIRAAWPLKAAGRANFPGDCGVLRIAEAGRMVCETGCKFGQIPYVHPPGSTGANWENGP